MVLLPESGGRYGDHLMVHVPSDQLVGLANGLVQGLASRFRLRRADLKPQPLLPVTSYYQLDVLPALGQLP